MGKILLVIVMTLGAVWWDYIGKRDVKRTLLSLATLALIVTIAYAGNILRGVMPLYLLHLVLVVVSWLSLILYIFGRRYHWWIYWSPLLLFALYFLMDIVAGARYES